VRISTQVAGSRLLALVTAAAVLALTACGASQTSTGSNTGTSTGSSTGTSTGMGSASQQQAAAANPDLDTGTTLSQVSAPDFRLANQFGQPVSLSSFRGKVVILAFTDSQCTTICPLTTASMVAARDLLGRAGVNVQLIGIDANPRARARSDVLAYSRSHGMVNQWDFLTGSLAQLHAVWKAYHIYVQIERGDIDHTPALYVIDTHGRERKLYLTTMAYATVGQAGELLAREAASLLPGHPGLASQQSLARARGISPAASVTLPQARAGSITLAPGRPRLMVFFATWLDETSRLRNRLISLNGYLRAHPHHRLPRLVAIDEAVTEPSPGTVRSFLAHLHTPLRYPVALDTTGRLADGYGVQDQPWFALVSASGKIVWKHDGWLPVSALEAAARRHS
jgi:cytochrome oxidase Cu insertion factor (SCO1/SenC/PrrC family)